ncbi:MAG: sulfate permease [Ekhidna sp.]|nr:sulfate permease [Ekhidna sp.]
MNRIQRFFPILQWLPNYQKAHLGGDVFAGLTVGIMLIPQGMAYALIAGLPPVYGLYASIVPQIIYAIFGTSRQLSVAPVAMDSLLVAAGVSVLATEGSDAYIGFALLLAFFMGLFQLLLGVFRMGFITNLLSKPVISGFTSAAALIIGLNQLKYLLGTEIEKSNKVYEIIWNALQKLDETHLTTLLIGVGGITVIKGVKKIHNSIPGALVAVVFGTVLVYGLQLSDSGVSIVQQIPEGLPAFSLPNFDLGKMGELIPLALTISVVAFMEAYSVAKAIETKRKDYKVVANQELIGLGAANLIGSLFQSYPVTGGFSRSAVNHQSGANTPLSSIISAGLIALTLLFLTPLFYYLPTAILASVIMVAVSSLVDFGYAAKLWRDSKVEFGLLMATFLVTLNFSMVPGIVTGVVLSILVLLYRAAYPHVAILGRLKGQREFRNIKRFTDLEVWENKLILRVDAPIAFINIQYVREFIEHQIDTNPEIKEIVLDASAISYIDASATQGFSDMIQSLHDKGVKVLIAELVGPVRDIFYKTGLLDEVEEKNIFLTVHDALEAGLESKTYPNREKAVQHGELFE